MKKYFKQLSVIIMALIFVLTGCTPAQSDIQNKPVIEEKQDSTQGQMQENIETTSEELRVEFIDIGQGDAILLQASNEVMIIDAGDNATEKDLVQQLKDRGISKIDYLVGTHPHADHIGGLDKIIDQFEIGKIYMPKKAHTTKTYESVLTSIKNKGYKITTGKAGVTFTFGENIKVEMLSPIKEEYQDLNDYSIVMKVTNGEDSFIFTGDAEKEIEHELVAAGVVLQADVLKLGHHGSSTSSSLEFVEAVNPEYAIILSGVDNKYGHPHKETLDTLNTKGITYYDSQTSGDITMISSGDGIKVQTEK
ncbi:MAG: MBL fold metallo-hydrolase [Cellulosilyticaceae bacterium]